MKNRFTLIFSLMMVASILLAACAPAATPTAAPAVAPTAGPTAAPKIVEVTKIVAGTPVVQVITATPAPTKAPVVIKPVTIWTKFNDTKPQNSQDQWMLATIQSLAGFEGIKLTNVFAPFDQINNKLQLAVQSSGDVPDLSYMDTPLDPYYNNKILMDITDYVKGASWYNDIDPVYFKPCTGPDGKIYCVPAITSGNMIYYWTSAYPNGFPKDSEALLLAAAEMKKAGKYAFSYNANQGTNLLYFSLIYSYGGRFTDEKGNSVFASPETVKAIEFIRKLHANKYVPDVSLAPGFDCETPFKDGSAGAWIAGSWGYVYLNPLKDYDGKTTFDNGALSIEEGIKAGKIKIADPMKAPGGTAYINVNGATGWAIPTGSKNVEGAKAVINYLMQGRNNADYAFAYGALPTSKVGLKDPRFVQSNYWTAASEIFSKYAMMVPVNKNIKSNQVLQDTIINLILKPNLDIMTELKKAQDDLNK